MHMRSISYTIHATSKFYAQNVSLLPLYNKIFVDGRSKLKPEGYDGSGCMIDPDLVIYRNNWIEYNATALCAAYELDNYIAMNGGRTNVSPIEWMNMDPFLREAFKLAFNKYAKDENQKQHRMQSDLEQKMESSKEYKSPFNSISKPTFIN